VGQDLEDSLALEELKKEVQQSPGLVMMTEDQYNRVLANDPDLNMRILLTFYRSKKNIVLLSLSWRNPPEELFESESR
jgi:hypothetical protein